MIPPTPWVRSFCPLSLLYSSVSDFQFRYTPVTVGKGCAAWFSLRSASVLSFGRGDKAAESGDIDDKYHHIIKGLYTLLSRCIDPWNNREVWVDKYCQMFCRSIWHKLKHNTMQDHNLHL